jgi:hypothetical protein
MNGLHTWQLVVVELEHPVDADESDDYEYSIPIECSYCNWQASIK